MIQGDFTRGVESETALVWPKSGVELHSVTPVDLHLGQESVLHIYLSERQIPLLCRSPRQPRLCKLDTDWIASQVRSHTLNWTTRSGMDAIFSAFLYSGFFSNSDEFSSVEASSAWG